MYCSNGLQDKIINESLVDGLNYEFAKEGTQAAWIFYDYAWNTRPTDKCDSCYESTTTKKSNLKSYYMQVNYLSKKLVKGLHLIYAVNK